MMLYRKNRLSQLYHHKSVANSLDHTKATNHKRNQTYYSDIN